MAFKKDENGNPILSPKQRAVLLYGQRLRGLGCVAELIKHLKELGFSQAANTVQGATVLLKSQAKKEYEARRKDLDPAFKDADDRFFEMLFEEKENKDG